MMTAVPLSRGDIFVPFHLDNNPFGVFLIYYDNDTYPSLGGVHFEPIFFNIKNLAFFMLVPFMCTCSDLCTYCVRKQYY